MAWWRGFLGTPVPLAVGHCVRPSSTQWDAAVGRGSSGQGRGGAGGRAGGGAVSHHGRAGGRRPHCVIPGELLPRGRADALTPRRPREPTASLLTALNREPPSPKTRLGSRPRLLSEAAAGPHPHVCRRCQRCAPAAVPLPSPALLLLPAPELSAEWQSSAGAASQSPGINGALCPPPPSPPPCPAAPWPGTLRWHPWKRASANSPSTATPRLRGKR